MIDPLADLEAIIKGMPGNSSALVEARRADWRRVRRSEAKAEA